MALAMEVGLSPGDFRVRWGPSPHPPQKGGGAHLPKFPPISIAVKGLDTSRCHLVWRYPSSLWTLCSMRTQPPPEKGGGPMFGPCLLRPNCCMDHDATWYGGRPQPRRLCVRWGPSSPPLKGHRPQFSAHARCGQTARWTKMPLGMEVGLGPGDSVFDGCPPEKRAHSPHPIFGPCLLWPNVCVDQDATWYGGRPQPTRHYVRWGPSSPSPKGAQPPIFGQCPLWPNG